jgi:hypothetical protein
MLEPRRYGEFLNDIKLIYLKVIFNFIKTAITVSVKQDLSKSLNFLVQLTKLTIIQIKIMRELLICLYLF